MTGEPETTREAVTVDTVVTSGTDDPLSDAQIQEYRQEINHLDRVIVDAIKRRAAVSQAVGRSRMGSGGTRLVHTREVAIINQFRDELGPEGVNIAVALLRMGRGRLGVPRTLDNVAQTSSADLHTQVNDGTLGQRVDADTAADPALRSAAADDPGAHTAAVSTDPTLRGAAVSTDPSSTAAKYF